VNKKIVHMLNYLGYRLVFYITGVE